MKGMKKIEVFKHVIARRERSERRGNPSCLEIYCLKVRYVYYVTVDRHAPKGLAMTRVVRTRVEIAVCSYASFSLFTLHTSIY
jgi:hypothetical protein